VSMTYRGGVLRINVISAALYTALIVFAT